VKAEIPASVKRVLRHRNVRVADLDAFPERFMAQAVAMYSE